MLTLDWISGRRQCYSSCIFSSPTIQHRRGGWLDTSNAHNAGLTVKCGLGPTQKVFWVDPGPLWPSDFPCRLSINIKLLTPYITHDCTAYAIAKMLCGPVFALVIRVVLLFGPHTTAFPYHDVDQKFIGPNYRAGDSYAGVLERTAPPYRGTPLESHGKWTVDCNSHKDKEHDCSKVIDGRESTFWTSEPTKGKGSKDVVIIIDLKKDEPVHGLRILPVKGQTGKDNPGRHEVYLRREGEAYGAPVAYGTWWNDTSREYPMAT
jgi:hypothetical protein